MSRGLSKMVQQKPNLVMFRELYHRAEAEQWSRWDQVAAEFLAAMWTFDSLIGRGIATQGENQNGKGDFFGDLVCLLLRNCSGKNLLSRPGTAGRVFENHALDASYPATGDLEVLIETKVCGAPISPRNSTSQKHPKGRPGSADLDKRIKEAAQELSDGCGLFAYRPASAGYESVPVPRALEMDIVVSRICERLRAAV